MEPVNLRACPENLDSATLHSVQARRRTGRYGPLSLRGQFYLRMSLRGGWIPTEKSPKFFRGLRKKIYGS